LEKAMPIAIAKKKERLDKLLTDLGLVESRTKAQAVILSGTVYVNGQKADKPGHLIHPELPIEIKGNNLPYVSRGGLKLVSALEKFNISPMGWVCVDIGASTGGFTDCLLQHSAKKVYAIDVGYGQLDMKLRKDSRVIMMEKMNARYLNQSNIPEQMDLATIDVSFISLKHILPAAKELLKNTGQLLALIKPQFEAGRKEIAKGGVVKDPKVREKCVQEIIEFAGNSGFQIKDTMESPVHGPAGNIEYFLWAEKVISH
jgi:23S rRNA (cytidine1920-2'-O)/16S rRNA (cytidine1409-2'-O)-methyltransferase